MRVLLNPRLVEPVNAAFAGVDLTGAMLEVSVGSEPETQLAGRPSSSACCAAPATTATAGRSSHRSPETR